MTPDVHTVVVTGEGIAYDKPDHYIINAQLNVTAATAEEALGRLASLTEDSIKALREEGATSDSVRTTAMALHEHYDRGKEARGRVASYALLVRTNTIDETGQWIAKLTSVGGESLQVNHVKPDTSNRKALVNKARTAAVIDARERAAQLADAAGVQLGEILEMSEPSDQSGLMSVRGVAVSGGGEFLPIEAGQVSSTVYVTMTFAIDTNSDTA
jgi:uncharacterized protein